MVSTWLANNPQWVQLVIIPLLIFAARITDVSIGTLRIIFISRGFRYWAPLIGFLEITIWLLAISQVMSHLDKPLYYIAYAAGFSAGTYLGLLFESKLAMGAAMLRVIAGDVSCQLLDALKQAGYGLTCIDGKGSMGDVKILFMIAKRRDIKTILEIVHKFNPNAVYTIEDVRSVNAATYPQITTRPGIRHRLANGTRKSK